MCIRCPASKHAFFRICKNGQKRDVLFNVLTKTDQKPILAFAIAKYEKGLNDRLPKPVAPAFVCFSAILCVRVPAQPTANKVKQSGSAIAQSPAALKAGAALNKN